jgi:hypothetical protein
MSGGQKARRGVAAAGLVVVAILLVMGWVHRRQPHEVVVPAPASHLPQQRIDAPPRTISTAVASHAETIVPAKGLEVCGLGKVTPATADASGINEYVTAATRKAYDRWKAALVNSSDYRARAVGLALQRFEFRADDSAVEAEESRDELIQLAAGAGDPAVYAIAVGLCRTALTDTVTEGACQRISLSEWTRIDPDNAVPWIAAAQAARDKGDTQAESSAFARAAAAHRIDNSGESLLSFALAEIPSDATPLEKATLSIQAVGYEAAWGRPELSEIARYCSEGAVKQDEIRTECSAVAELLVRHGGTVLNLGLGERIGERVGWPSERTSSIARERDAMVKFDAIDEHDPWSCQSVSRLNAYMEKRIHLGELAALRDQLERSGPLP